MTRVPRLRIMLLVLVLTVVATACSREDTPTASKAFCRAAERYNTELERQQKRGEIDTDRQIARVEDLVAEAPPEVEADAQTFLDALRRVEDDPSIKGDPKVQEAVDNVNRFANQACGVYERRGGGL